MAGPGASFPHVRERRLAGERVGDIAARAAHDTPEVTTVSEAPGILADWRTVIRLAFWKPMRSVVR